MPLNSVKIGTRATQIHYSCTRLIPAVTDLSGQNLKGLEEASSSMLNVGGLV